jgi:hypothetical protein
MSDMKSFCNPIPSLKESLVDLGHCDATSFVLDFKNYGATQRYNSDFWQGATWAVTSLNKKSLPHRFVVSTQVRKCVMRFY